MGKIVMILNLDTNMIEPMKKEYIKPMSEEVNIALTTLLAMSGYGDDTYDDYEFGGRGANERRGTWGNLWE